MDCSPSGSSVHEMFQARILEQVAISYARGSSQTRDWTHISCFDKQTLYQWATREVPSMITQYEITVTPLTFLGPLHWFILHIIYYWWISHIITFLCIYYLLFHVWSKLHDLWEHLCLVHYIPTLETGPETLQAPRESELMNFRLASARTRMARGKPCWRLGRNGKLWVVWKEPG